MGERERRVVEVESAGREREWETEGGRELERERYEREREIGSVRESEERVKAEERA